MLAARMLLAPLSLALAGQVAAAEWILPAPTGGPALEARSLTATATVEPDGHLDVVLSLALVVPPGSTGPAHVDVGSLEQARASLAGQPLSVTGDGVELDLEAGEAVIVEMRGRLSPDRLDWLSEGEAGWFGRSRGPVLQPMSRLVMRHRVDSAFAAAPVSLRLDVGDAPMTAILATPGVRLAHGSARWEGVTLAPPSKISVAWPLLGGTSFLPRTSEEAAEAIVDWQARHVEADDVRQLSTVVLDAASAASDPQATRAAATTLSEHARMLEQRAAASRRVADATPPPGTASPAPQPPAEAPRAEPATQAAPQPSAAASPIVTVPSDAQREEAKRQAAQREEAKREATRAEAAQREDAKREATRAEAAQREEAKREATRAEAAQREEAKRETAQREAKQREEAELAAAQKKAAQREAVQREVEAREAAQHEATERAAAQREAAQREAAERDAARRAEAQREADAREAARREAEEREQAHRDAERIEQARLEQTRRDAAEIDAARRAEQLAAATRRAHELAAAEVPTSPVDVPWIRDVAQARLFLAGERQAGLRRDRIEEAIAIIRARQGDPFDDDPQWRDRFDGEPWYAPRDPDGMLENAPETDAALNLLRQAI